MPLCSCGCAEPHVVAQRETADGVRLSIWSDAAVTHGRLGRVLVGLGAPRSRFAQRARAAAVRLLMDEVGILDINEIAPAIKAAEKTYAHTWSSDDARRAFVLHKIAG